MLSSRVKIINLSGSNTIATRLIHEPISPDSINLNLSDNQLPEVRLMR